ncbi:hypothetical protein [Streptomyces virginiae]|uniref:hypothetical protein n=1 Tax=Streptomyces virginiae TaxID=1961 RepID=UPI0022540DA6|nr:hypothetical protein [Streptomyces virginiae]MCX5276354.1 hypothetical protein [Streptomyces virginiae]
MHGLEQLSGVSPGLGVRRGVLGGVLDRCGTGLTGRGQSCGQAAAVGGGDVLDAVGEALPEVKSIAELHGGGCPDRDALPVGEGSIAAGDLDTWVFAEPAAELPP